MEAGLLALLFYGGEKNVNLLLLFEEVLLACAITLLLTPAIFIPLLKAAGLSAVLNQMLGGKVKTIIPFSCLPPGVPALKLVTGGAHQVGLTVLFCPSGWTQQILVMPFPSVKMSCCHLLFLCCDPMKLVFLMKKYY